MTKKNALITGATAGIGKATALLFAKNNFDIIITGRRLDLLNELSEKITSETNSKVTCLCFDVRNSDQVNSELKKIIDANTNIDVLVNNAGLASGLEPIQEGDHEDWEKMIDTNIKGLLYITRKIAPLMVKQSSGHIINIGSIAGKEIYANGAVYCATKAAVDFLTKGMRIDLLQHGIKVTSINPGMVETEFSLVRFHGDKQRADSVYNGVTPLSAEDIADAILYAVSRPAHVNINDMVIMPTVQASVNHLLRK